MAAVERGGLGPGLPRIVLAAPPPARRSTAASFRSRMGMETGLVM